MVAIRFGSFVLDREEGRLKGMDGPVHLSPKALSLLDYLIRERPRVVPKAEIVDEIWPDVLVEEQNVKNLVVEIRKGLDDDAENPRFIRNSFGRGYAFCAEAWEADSQRKPMRGRLISPGDRTYPIRDGENLIGRDPGCAIVLDASGVSRYHAKIVASEGSFMLEDLGSKNGTWVDGQRIEAFEIRDGSEIRIGRAALVFREASDRDSTSTIIGH